jgi:hypothetical protein
VSISKGDELTTKQQSTLLSALLTDWQAAQYQHKVSYEVAELLGDPQTRLDSLRSEIERCQKAIKLLREKISHLEE